MLRDGVNKISDAIKSHTKWMENINKCLICDMKPEHQFLDKDAYKLCEFGKWIEQHKEKLKEIDLKVFYDVYEEHQQLHTKAKEMLDLSLHNKPISVELYDKFIKLSTDIKKTLRKFRAKFYDNEAKI